MTTSEKFSHICVCYFQVKTNMGNFSDIVRSIILKHHNKIIFLKFRKFSLDGPVVGTLAVIQLAVGAPPSSRPAVITAVLRTYM